MRTWLCLLLLRIEGEDLRWKRETRVENARQDKAVGESSGQP
jgi:hypothetical protein